MRICFYIRSFNIIHVRLLNVVSTKPAHPGVSPLVKLEIKFRPNARVSFFFLTTISFYHVYYNSLTRFVLFCFCFVLFLFCFVLFCFVLFCFVLFCFVLFCFVLFFVFFVLFLFLFFCFALFCFVFYLYLTFNSFHFDIQVNFCA